MLKYYLLKMEPEQDDGNIEYKLKLLGKNVDRIQQLESQMRYRVNEGKGEAMYVLGVTDKGVMVGLTSEEFKESFNNLLLAAKNSMYTLNVLTEKTVDGGGEGCKIYEILVRENNINKYIDIKVTVAGNVDSGKSTLLGVLTSGNKDDGRGSARLSVFNFAHEISSGRTSSIAQHILGFDAKGNSVNCDGRKDWPDIVKMSSKIITFYDLCGHEKYLKTTILGLTSSCPDLCLILIGANMGITKMTQEHIFICVTLNIPFVIIVTKVDICQTRQNVLEDTVKNINILLKRPGLRKIPYKVNNIDDVILCSKNIHSESIVPIFHISSVTGVGIDNLLGFLNLLGKHSSNIKETKEVEYYIDNTFTVTGVGTVIGGHLISGRINVGDKLLIGPNQGKFNTIQIKSIHCKRVALQSVDYGCYVCLGVKFLGVKKINIRKGNVIVSTTTNPIAVQEFNCDITVLKAHSTTIKLGYEPVIQTSTIRQTATLIDINNKQNDRFSSTDNEKVLRIGDKATVRFRFKCRPEYIKQGTKLLMTEGKVKVIGSVI